MLDLPEHAVLVCGLEGWRGHQRTITEERLAARVAEQLGAARVELNAPPLDSDDQRPSAGVQVIEFPGWYLAQVEQSYTALDGRVYRTRPLLPRARLDKGKYLDDDKKRRDVVPIRFVQACQVGHISDIDWYAFVRGDGAMDRTGQLWLDEGGAGNDFAEIYVRCERTGRRRCLAEATLPNAHTLGQCQGHRPWLGARMSEPCEHPNRLLTRAASHAYFAHTMSAISIPEAGAKLKEAVGEVYSGYLSAARSVEQIKLFRTMPDLNAALHGFSDEEVWAEVVRRQSPPPAQPRGLKQAELETLLSVKPGGPEVVGDEFQAQARALEQLPPALGERLERVVLVHRLREVIAQVGFTRIDSATTDADGELSLDVKLAPLSRRQEWVPAMENKGEGVFLSFSTEAIHAWLQRPAVQRRAEAMEECFAQWAKRKELRGAVHPGVAYVMLHSLSHLLISAVSLECGYSASSIRERVYAREAGYGILLYTGVSGSGGTLGGLVDVGRRIEHHLRAALELGALCSNDPICAQHDPRHPYEERFLHGAACHGCLLIAETSCERHNDYLDRALVVPTVEHPDAAFFPELWG
jgi:hypothetical protein